jgi:hypothetical protein
MRPLTASSAQWIILDFFAHGSGFLVRLAGTCPTRCFAARLKRRLRSPGKGWVDDATGAVLPNPSQNGPSSRFLAHILCFRNPMSQREDAQKIDFKNEIPDEQLVPPPKHVSRIRKLSSSFAALLLVLVALINLAMIIWFLLR